MTINKKIGLIVVLIAALFVFSSVSSFIATSSTANPVSASSSQNALSTQPVPAQQSLEASLSSMGVSLPSQTTSIGTLSGFSYSGPVSSGTQVTATLVIPLRNIAELESMSEEISSPGSPLYHHFLTSAQEKSMFYPTVQYDCLMTQLNELGLKIISTSSDSIITVQGSSSQISSIFGLTENMYSNGTAYYYAGSGPTSFDGAILISSNVSAILHATPTTLITEPLKSPDGLGARSKTAQAPVFGLSYYLPTALEAVYGATSMYAEGYNGTNQNIGILDYLGDPCIAQQLNYYDFLAKIPNPPSFTIQPIGPYDPELGVAQGWCGEISLDVESSHSMAPGANQTLYIANGNCFLITAIGFIDQQDKVNSLSQSFSIPESETASFSPQLTLLCSVLPNLYYELGSDEGITFSASSGDAGGSGYSNGAIGSIGLPAASPYVTALGGTTTYIDFQNACIVCPVVGFNQTAWTNYGFVPNFVNYGGSSGGISDLSPLPWYQQDVTVTQSHFGFPNGRLVPDISLNADIFPGVIIVFPQQQLGITGGTSEASPLFAGLVALIDQSLGTRVGLINPDLYDIASNSSEYSSAFYPITFGYNIPWDATYGYNLVTGLGAINVYNLSKDIAKLSSKGKSLSIDVSVPVNAAGDDSIGEYYAGQNFTISANITNSTGVTVSSGTFTATIESLQLTSTVSMAYNSTSHNWTGTYHFSTRQTGITCITVSGSSNGVYGNGTTQVFAGFASCVITPVVKNGYSISAAGGLEFEATISYLNCTFLNATNSPFSHFNYSLYSYSILDNSYTFIGNVTIHPYNKTSDLWVGVFDEPSPLGPMIAIGQNTYSYDPFMHGEYLQTAEIFPPVNDEPGAAAPGQDVLIKVLVKPAFNIIPITRDDIELGSTVYGSLVNSAGVTVANFTTFGSPACGELIIPMNVAPGLYTIIINSTYSSYEYGAYLNGSYFGQILVVPGHSVPQVSLIPSVIYQGDQVTIVANITAPSGKEIKYGVYSATFYPVTLQDDYYLEAQTVFLPLEYDPSANLWVGVMQLPSDYSNGEFVPYTSVSWLPYGPWDIFISGVSSSGIPTSNCLCNEIPFYINPGFELAITSPPHEVISNSTSDTMVISGVTSGVTVMVNGVSVPVIDGTFTTNVTLQEGLNIFNVVAQDIYGNTETTTVSALYLPQLSEFQNDISAINSKITRLNGSVSAQLTEITTLEGELTSLSAEVTTINETYHVNTTNLQSEISATSAKLASLQKSLEPSGVNIDLILAIVALVLGVAGLGIGIVAMRGRNKK